jgi:hypothetical protein
MKSILILFSRYDVNSSYTAGWARGLHEDLLKQKNTTSFLYDAQYLCHSRGALDDALERADYVVFYGHGTQTGWTAVPDYSGASGSVPAIPLVDNTSVSVLRGRKVYAGCCSSLNLLGRDYIAQFPQGEFVGYNHEFGFEATNADYFKEVMNQSVSGFVSGDPAATVVTNLQNEWAGLRDKFYKGNLQRKPNAAYASQVADLNRQRIGCKP